ncbi:serine/threonine protein kinase [Streptomyces cavernicola]|uniref:Serine/threonine-protein kinase n=1 Tax=Streptomyces cavernicola TaxID=3043613 RepID=A0ABT6SIG3_9ACTN|nr:serine/threonine-protein kinase [Streptomyces sp. B-S-A6]MDI3407452.1 serine/threonine-protein kinase [Streptomyces sp. B-S-A6]
MDALKPQDPAQIGSYTLLARLGAGGMGQVYLGRSPGGLLVAIKVIKDEIADHPEVLARFRREAETVRAVRSAYTANLIDASLEEAPFWLATEYVAGPTLSGAVRDRGAFPAETCRSVFAALAEGLGSVHAYGVTHRDLKPQNVILSTQGPQLIDFGIARGVEQTALTEAGFAPGTPGFTAPEVLMRNQVSPAADVFALGATLAYMATGRPPFGSGESAAVGYRTVYEQIDLEGVEPELASLIDACAAKDPADRPTPGEVVERCAVRSALVEDAFYAGVVGPVEPVPQTPRPEAPPLHDAPTTTAGAAPVGYTPTATAGAAPAGYTPTQVSASPGRPRKRLTAVAAAVAVGVAAATAVVLLPGDDGEQDKGANPGGATKSPTAPDDRSKGKVPEYVEATAPSRDFWTADPTSEWERGRCNLPAEESNEHLQYSVTFAGPSGGPYTGGKGTISIRLKYADPSLGKPYSVAVAVKPPHEIDDRTGKPYEGTRAQNLSLGYVSKPVDLMAQKDNGDVKLTYPDDFRQHVRGKDSGGGIPIGNDPGNWTVLFLHAKGVKEYATIGCDGFTVE